jgi:DNA-binding beta-propeller fold protein YncE
VAEIGLVSPQAVAVDGRNRYFLVDAETHAVFVLNEAGKAPSKWGEFGAGDGQFNTPLGIALDAEANLLVADSGNNRIKKCAPDGRFLGAWAVDGAPRAVTVGPGGKVYVLAGRRILRFSPEGALEATLAAEAGFEDPRGLAVDGAGFLYVTDAARSSVTKLDENGAVISTWGSPGSGPGQLAAPSGVAVDAQGRVVVVERDNNRLQVFILGAGPGEGAGP